jgi:hypothetical protein
VAASSSAHWAKGLSLRIDAAERLAHQRDGGAVVLVGGRLAEAAVDAVGELDDERRLHAARLARDGKHMPQRQLELVGL